MRNRILVIQGLSSVIFIVFVLLDICNCNDVEIGQKTFETQDGVVIGILSQFPGRHLKPIRKFFGLVYGTTRKTKLRFMPPSNPTEKWPYNRVAMNFRPVCAQKFVRESELRDRSVPDNYIQTLTRIAPFIKNRNEDCLFLNMFVPVKDKNDTSRFPVMVFVHGESYDIGTGNAYDGSVLASYGKVIVVTVNYRLGVLGFLSTGHTNANGNQALLDLLAVLIWINTNIGYFDGDPDRVTLFGHGHGAALVNLLLLSPLINHDNYIHRAILQSGSALSSWALSVDPLTCAQKLAVKVNCSSYMNNSKDLVQCLKNRTAEELVENAPLPPKYFSCFAPTTEDGSFFRHPLNQLLKQRNTFSNISIMLGVTKNEAYSFLKQQELENGISKFRKSQIIRTYVQNVYKYHRQKIFEILEHHYSEWDRMQDDNSRRDNMMQLLSDGQYVAPLIKTAQEHSKSANTYMYAFGYSTQSEDFPKWSSGVHGDELPYIFGAPLVDGLSPFPSKYTRLEKRLSAAVMRFWTNFAKSGNPNIPVRETSFDKDKFADIEWPKYDIADQQYLLIGKRPFVKHHYRGKQIALWLDLIPKINKEDSFNVGKPDSAEHNLIDPKNMSTFDEPNRLMTHFRLSSSHYPLFPETSHQQDDTAPTNKLSNTSVDGLLRPTDQSKDVTIEDKEELTTAVAPISGSYESESIAHTSVPLSITVAVGCSLLFINILIFAAVYYQRERIRKLKKNEQMPDDDLPPPIKDENDQDQLRHETSSLMTIGQNQAVAVNIVSSSHDVHNNPIYSAISKSSDTSSDKYSYTAVPTSSSSPLHRCKNPHTHMNSIPASHKGINSFSGRPPDNKSVTLEQNTYSNDKYNQISNKEHNSKNAITIV